MSDLMGVTLHLRPTHRDTVPCWLGRAARAMLLHSIESIQPELSVILHNLPGDKPFTAGTLVGGVGGELLELDPAQPYTLRYTTLAADLTRLMRQAVVPRWQRGGIRLHDQPMRVEAVTFDEAAQSVPYQTLLDEAARRKRQRTRLTLRFETPTYFKVTGQGGGRLPTPEYVFGKSLLRRWNAFSPVRMPEDTGEFIAASVEVESVRGLHTSEVSLERAGKNRVVGFVGEVTYYVPAADELLASCVWALGMFAPYSGVGAQTADGFGRTILVETNRQAAR